VARDRPVRRRARLAAQSLLVAGLLTVTSCSSDPSAAPYEVRPGAAARSHTHAPGTGPHSHGRITATPLARPAAVPLRNGERSVTLRLPGGPYRPAGPNGGLDDYRCFLLDPKLGRDVYVTGSDVLPGNPAMVHHAILFAVPPGEVEAAEAHDEASPGPGWTCFGGSALPNRTGSAARALDSAPWLAGWAPGSGETVFRQRTGKRLPAGSRIVLQLHYNLREGHAPDDTAVRLRLMPGSADMRALQTMLLVAPVELPCTPEESGPLCDRSQSLLDLVRRFGPEAGRTVSGLQLLCGGSFVDPAAGRTQSCDRRAPDDMVVRAVAGHMHLLGKSIRVELDPGTAGARTLLDREVWDFDNQKATPLQRPVRVRSGDALRVTCTHDAQLRSLVPELADEAPRYVTWGEGTSDEMCLGIVLYTRN
jgi:hypothetical protein